MAWYLNHYYCGDCGTDWDDEWSCSCDDECPACGSGDWSPVTTEDLTEIVCDCNDHFEVKRSSPLAEEKPRYLHLASFRTLEAALRFGRSGEIV